ncbi:MAG: MFS transporter [Deltaproteobacteria bacterium]|nr:MFS transporter [Deltaproteobacteria bacterium]
MFKFLKIKIYYGWIIVVLSVIITLIIAGTRFSFGVFFKPMANEFNLMRAETASIYSMYMILCIFFTILGGWALDKYGPKIVFFLMGLFTGLSYLLTGMVNSLFNIYLTYSLLFAIGTASFYPVMAANISKWFDKKRGLALGITASGGRSGQAVFAPFSAFLIASYGWRMSFLIIGFVAWLIIIPASMLMKKGPREVGSLPDGGEAATPLREDTWKKPIPAKESLSFSQAIRTRDYWFSAPTWLMTGFSGLLIYTHIVPYATDMNISPMQAATIITVIGGSALLSGIVIGRITDTVGTRIPITTLSLLMSLSLIMLIWSRELWHFYSVAVLFGFCMGGIAVIIALISADIFGNRSLGLIMASLDAVFSIGASIGPFIGGLIYDIYGSYDYAFFMGAVGFLISCFLVSLIKPGHIR